MSLFGRKKIPGTAPTALPPTAAPSTEAVIARVPIDLAGVKAEWEASMEEGFGQGWAFFDNPDLPPAQALNGAEYLTRGLRAELHSPGSTGYDADTIREGCKRVVIMAGRVPHEIAWQAQPAQKYIRLGLMLMKLNGWQPVRYGGDGSIKESDLAVDRSDLLIGAIEPAAVDVSEALAAFFSRPL